VGQLRPSIAVWWAVDTGRIRVISSPSAELAYPSKRAAAPIKISQLEMCLCKPRHHHDLLTIVPRSRRSCHPGTISVQRLEHPLEFDDGEEGFRLAKRTTQRVRKRAQERALCIK
jgi:hypothetical protein